VKVFQEVSRPKLYMHPISLILSICPAHHCLFSFAILIVLGNTNHKLHHYALSKFLVYFISVSNSFHPLKVKLSLQQVVEAHRVVRQRGSHIF
jgi:hypothetical protein